MTNQITFTTKQVEASANQILLSRATRASKKDGKEIPAAFKPLFAVVEVPFEIANIANEFIKLAALNGVQAAYQKLIAAKLPLDLLKTSNGADQIISIDESDLLSVLKSEAGESRRLTKELINGAWQGIQATALQKLCILKKVEAEKFLPDSVRRQFSAAMLKRLDFALSFASTTGARLHSDEALNSALPWMISLVEAEASSDGWIFAAILEKITNEIQRRDDERNAAAEESEESEETVDLSELF